MARHGNNISGKIGNIIVYDRKGTTCSRSMPVRVRQTKATKAAAANFGKVARINRALRLGLQDILPDYKDSSIMLRLNKQLLPLIKDTGLKGFIKRHASVENFQFNEEADIQERIKIPLTIEWKKKSVFVQFTRSDMFHAFKAPAGTIAIHLELAISSCKIADTTLAGKYFMSIKLTENEPGTSIIEMPFQLQSGCLTIVVAALKYEKIVNRIPRIVNNKKWLPAGIVGSFFGKPE